MSLNAGGVLGDAWAMAKRDRSLLATLAGLFFFLPQLALHLFVAPPAAVKGPPSLVAMAESMQAWYLDHAIALLVIQMWTIAGMAVLLAMYLARGAETVRDALSFGLRLLPGLIVIELLGNLAIGIGLLLFILPGYYLIGRLLLAGPILAAETRTGPLGALEHSMRQTRGHGFVCAGLGVMATIVGYLVSLPIVAIGDALDRAPHANPVSETLIDVGLSGVSAAAMLGGVLIRIALYRRLAAS